MAEAGSETTPVEVTVRQLLKMVNVLEQARRRGTSTGRAAAEDAQRPLLARLRELRPDLGFHDAANQWYLGDAPVVTYASFVQVTSGGKTGAAPAERPPKRLSCAFCDEHTDLDDAANLVEMRVRAVDGSYWYDVGAHVWCLPDEVSRYAPNV